MAARGTFIPKDGERALIVGQTGSGKTAFAQWLIVRIPRAPIFIYDTKIEPKFDMLPNNTVVSTVEQMNKEFENEKVDYIIVRPHDDLLGKPEELDDFLYHHYMNFHHSVCFIDELYTFHNNGRGFKGLQALLSRGRSKGITTIGCTQRPVSISRLCITEAQKVYAFKLGDRQDRKRLADVIPNFDDYPIPKNHAFYFFESGEDQAQLMRPVKLDKAYDTGYTDTQSVSSPSSPNAGSEPTTKHVWV